MRPICPDVRTETSMSGKFIAAYLTPFVKRLPTYIANSMSLLRILGNLRHIPKDAVWLVADIDQLYPSIPVDDAYRTVCDVIEESRRDSSSNSDVTPLVLELLYIHLNYNFLEFEGQCFLQKPGVPMGKAWAPAVACLYMAKWERELMATLRVMPLVFVRYIDDLLFLFPNAEAARSALASMNQLYTNIQIGDYTIGRDVHFLDCQLHLVRFDPSLNLTLSFLPGNGELVPRVSVYRKPTDLIAILQFCSAHSWNVKVNTLFGQCLRLVRVSNDPFTAGKNVFTLLAVMCRFRALPLRTLRKIRLRLFHAFARDRCTTLLSYRGNRESKNTPQIARHSVLRLPVNIDHTLFRKCIRTLGDMLSLRERKIVGQLLISTQRSNKLQNILFK
jgi:hypothetical protein